MKTHNILASLALASSLVAISACSKEEKPAEPAAEPAPTPPPPEAPAAPAAPAAAAGAADIKPEDADKVAADLEKEIEADTADEDKQ